MSAPTNTTPPCFLPAPDAQDQPRSAEGDSASDADKFAHLIAPAPWVIVADAAQSELAHQVQAAASEQGMRANITLVRAPARNEPGVREQIAELTELVASKRMDAKHSLILSDEAEALATIVEGVFPFATVAKLAPSKSPQALSAALELLRGLPRCC